MSDYDDNNYSPDNSGTYPQNNSYPDTPFSDSSDFCGDNSDGGLRGFGGGGVFGGPDGNLGLLGLFGLGALWGATSSSSSTASNTTQTTSLSGTSSSGGGSGTRPVKRGRKGSSLGPIALFSATAVAMLTYLNWNVGPEYVTSPPSTPSSQPTSREGGIMPAQTVPVQDGNQQVGKHYLKLDPREGFCVTTKRDGDMNIPEVPSGYKGAPACSSGNAVSGISQAYAEKHRDDPGKHYYLAHDKEGNYCVVEMPRKALGNVDVPKDSFHRCWFPKHSEITQPQGGGEMARPKFVVQGLPYQLKLGQT